LYDILQHTYLNIATNANKQRNGISQAIGSSQAFHNFDLNADAFWFLEHCSKSFSFFTVDADQMSRINSARIAGIKAEAGIIAVIQSGDSMRDAGVIEAIDKAGMAMVFTGMRHFRH
jgi:hypothetical protein